MCLKKDNVPEVDCGSCVPYWQLDFLLLLRCLRQASPALPILFLYYEEIGLTVSDMFMVSSINSIVTIVSEVPSGWVADRLQRKKTLLAAFFTLAFSYWLLSLASYSVYFVWVAAVVKPIAIALFSGTDVAVVHETVRALGLPASEGYRCESQHVFYVLLTEAFFCVVGGYVSSAMSLQHAVLMSVLPGLVGGMLCWLLLVSPPVIAPAGKHNASQEVPPFRTILQHSVVGILPQTAVLSACTYFTIWINPMLWKLSDVDPSLFGWVASAITLCSAVGSRVSPQILKRCNDKKERVVSVLCGLVVISYFLFALSSIWSTLVGNALLGLARGIMWPLATNYINEKVGNQDGMRASCLSTYAGLCKGATVVTGPLIGHSIDEFGLYSTCSGIASAVLLLPALSLAACSEAPKLAGRKEPAKTL